jgi:flagellar biogenesis protein FliO
MVMLCLYGVSAQAYTSTHSVPESKESSIEEQTPGLPLRKDGVIPQGTLIRVSIAIFIGLVLAIVGAYLLKRYLFARNPLGSSDQRMQLLEVKRLSPRLTLFRVCIDDKTIVLAQNGEHLIELDPAKTFKTRQVAIDDEVR